MNDTPKSDTPETDRAWHDCIAWLNQREEREDPHHVALADLCEKLERERNESRLEVEKLKKGKPLYMLPDDVKALSDANAELANYCDRLIRERNEARVYADKLAQGLPVGMLPKDVENLRDANANLATEVEKWKMRFTSFAATQAADYGRDRYGEGCMHFTHYDLLKEAGARMDSFKRCGDPLITP